MKKVLLMVLPFLIVSCKNSEAEEICDCIKEATNYYISKGVKATTKDLGEFCKRESLTVEDFSSEEKKLILSTAEDALLKIENKEFFEGFPNEGIPKFDNIIEFGKAYNEFVAKHPYADKNYFFKKVNINGTVVVDNENSNNYYDVDNIQIVSYDYTNKTFTENTIFIELKKDEKKNINFSTKVRLYPPDVSLDAYTTSFNQILKFEDAEIVSFSNGVASVRFPKKITYMKPIKDKDKIMDNEYFSFNYNDSNKVIENESNLHSDIHETETEKIIDTDIEHLQNKFKTIKTEKAFFYNSPDQNSKKKSYLIKDQKVEILSVYENFYNVKYTNESGKVVIGWLSNDDLI